MPDQDAPITSRELQKARLVSSQLNQTDKKFTFFIHLKTGDCFVLHDEHKLVTAYDQENRKTFFKTYMHDFFLCFCDEVLFIESAENKKVT